jgi:hypothetical protein
VTDIFYTRTLLFQWNNFSIWLITGGLILAALASFSLAIDVLLGRAGPINWPRFALVACNKAPAPPDTQYGAHPQLPKAQKYLPPPMEVHSL